MLAIKRSLSEAPVKGEGKALINRSAPACLPSPGCSLIACFSQLTGGMQNFAPALSSSICPVAGKARPVALYGRQLNIGGRFPAYNGIAPAQKVFYRALPRRRQRLPSFPAHPE